MNTMRAVQLLILGIALVTFGLVIVASLFEWPIALVTFGLVIVASLFEWPPDA